jgi:hypothetical protein
LNKDFTSKEYLELYPNEETIKNSGFQKKKQLEKNKNLVRDIELTNTKFWSKLQLGSQLQSS